ncbi:MULTISPECIES: heme A synthase [unclassified Leptolyngbya]|uniref:COX15/CtaA family protein n=1 Tax=unclassified Leptolyngbya TaxID=2650499 RepID=UPI001F5508E5|nr:MULTISPECIES: heme A synthase [unclassified Leptolyngbya]
MIQKTEYMPEVGVAPLVETSAADQPLNTTEPAIARTRWLVWKLAIATWLLMAVGSATRVMNAGLACPDWPLCYGTLFPAQQMNLQVFLEWFHRLDAALIGGFTIVLLGYTLWERKQLPRWVPWTSALALGLILIQGLLGGLTVTEMLRFDIVTAHLGTALLFFSTLLVMGVMLRPYQGTGTVGYLPWVSLGAAVLVYLQSLSGGLVGSRWALHQCLGGFGNLCTVMNAHLLGVVPASVAVLVLVVLAWRTPALHRALRTLTNLAFGFLLLQVLLGVATFRLHLQVELLTVSHQMIGACLLGTLVCFTTFGLRDRHQTRSWAETATET